MKQLTFIFGFVFFLCTLINNEVYCQSVFHHSYGDTLAEESYCVYLTTDTSYIMTGYSNSFNSNNDVYVLKTDIDGNLNWSKSIHILGNDMGYSLIEDRDTAQYYLVTGDTKIVADDTSYTDVFLMMTTQAGDPYFVNLFGNSNYNENARCIVKTNDSAYVIVGYTDDVCASCGSHDIYLIKTDLTGGLLWAKNIDISGGDDFGMKLIVDSVSYIITGYTLDSSNLSQAFLISTKEDGSVNWARTYGGTANDYSYSVVKSDTGYTIAGHTYSYDTNTDPDVFVVKTNLTGVVNWKTKYDSNRNKKQNFARDIVYYDQTYYLTGYADVNSSSSFDLSLLRLDNIGQMVWQHAYGGGRQDQGFSLINHNNRLVATGLTYSFGNGKSDAYLVKTDHNGVLDCYNAIVDRNTTYLDSTFNSPHTSVEEINYEYESIFTWVSPMENDSICQYDTIPHDTARFGYTVIDPIIENIKVYPNPQKAGSDINIQLSKNDPAEVRITVYDMLGKPIFNTNSVYSSGSGKFSFITPIASPGFYIIRVTGEGIDEMVKLGICK